MSLTRYYTDVNGNKRVARHVRTVQGLIGWRKTEHGIVYSPASIWELEDNSIVQIPEEAWVYLNIDYSDKVELKSN